METFNGIAFRDLGLVVQSVQGILDMPKRNGESLYDWGDEFEPLVSAEDIYFGSRKIIVDALYDTRKHNQFVNVIHQLEAITVEAPLVTEYGTNTVRLEELNVLKKFKGGSRTLRIVFSEMNPQLGVGMPNRVGDSSIRIDGYDLFVEFGFLVESVILFELQKLKNSSDTTHKTNVISIYRQPMEISVKINGIYTNKTDMSVKISALNALLAKPGLRHFIYKEFGFQCLCDEGTKLVIRRNRVVLTLKLKVMAYYNYDEIVQEVINQVNIQANPQSDLAVTDPGNPAFIKSKDTFVAADSSKLGNQLPAHYAKEAEIAALRALDLALALETATPNI